MPTNLENSAVATGLERSVFIQIPKKENGKQCSNYHTIALISHASWASLVAQRLKHLLASACICLQCGVLVQWCLKFSKPGFSNTWTMNFQMFKLDLEKAEEPEIIHWIIKKAREFRKNIYFFFIDYAKAFDCVDHNKLWKILKEMRIPDHLTCLLRNLYAGQEATVRTGHGTTDWF